MITLMVLVLIGAAGAAAVLVIAAVLWAVPPAGRAVAALLYWARGLVYRGDHSGGAGLGLASPGASPAPAIVPPAPGPGWGARWDDYFRAGHNAAQVFAAADQAGGWASGTMAAPFPGDPPWTPWPPDDDSGGGGDDPPIMAPPPPVLNVGQLYAPAAGGPMGNEGGTGDGGPGADHPAAPAPGLFEIAHEEEYQPAPVPRTAEAEALAAQVRAWCSEMDAGTLNYLHDYAVELRAA